MVAEVARRKALAYVLEQASVVDTDGTVIDLDAAVPQTDDDTEDVADIDASTEVVESEVVESGVTEVTEGTGEDAPADEDATAKA
jgi:trigger factor